MLLDGDELERSRAYLLLSECWDNYFYDKIISLLPPQYQTTNAAAEFDKYVDITKHCANNRRKIQSVEIPSYRQHPQTKKIVFYILASFHEL